MKKFRFNQANLGEVLSREELKLITGGSDVDSSQYRCSGISPEQACMRFEIIRRTLQLLIRFLRKCKNRLWYLFETGKLSWNVLRLSLCVIDFPCKDSSFYFA